jgi:hypothetical protein
LSAKVLRNFVTLVILGLVIGLGRAQLSDDGRIPDIRHFRHHFLGLGLLLRRLVINRGTILRADVVALPVQGSRVVDRKEDFQQLTEADLVGVECHCYYFGMAGRAFADLLIAWVGYLAAGISRFDLLHAPYLLVNRLQAPEASAP